VTEEEADLDPGSVIPVPDRVRPFSVIPAKAGIHFHRDETAEDPPEAPEDPPERPEAPPEITKAAVTASIEPETTEAGGNPAVTLISSVGKKTNLHFRPGL
jgi:hypothetical protein